MRGLGCGVNDGVGTKFIDEIEDAFPVADVELVVMETFEGSFESLLIPSGVTLRSEKYGALVVVDTVDLPSEFGIVDADLRSDKSRRTCDEKRFQNTEKLKTEILKLGKAPFGRLRASRAG